MYSQPSEWSNTGTARAPEARSIGSILSELPEIAALRAAKGRRLRKLALRRNSA